MKFNWKESLSRYKNWCWASLQKEKKSTSGSTSLLSDQQISYKLKQQVSILLFLTGVNDLSMMKAKKELLWIAL